VLRTDISSSFKVESTFDFDFGYAGVRTREKEDEERSGVTADCRTQTRCRWRMPPRLTCPLETRTWMRGSERVVSSPRIRTVFHTYVRIIYLLVVLLVHTYVRRVRGRRRSIYIRTTRVYAVRVALQVHTSTCTAFYVLLLTNRSIKRRKVRTLMALSLSLPLSARLETHNHKNESTLFDNVPLDISACVLLYRMPSTTSANWTGSEPERCQTPAARIRIFVWIPFRLVN